MLKTLIKGGIFQTTCIDFISNIAEAGRWKRPDCEQQRGFICKAPKSEKKSKNISSYLYDPKKVRSHTSISLRVITFLMIQNKYALRIGVREVSDTLEKRSSIVMNHTLSEQRHKSHDH
jgi:hypothetical protein